MKNTTHPARIVWSCIALCLSLGFTTFANSIPTSLNNDSLQIAEAYAKICKGFETGDFNPYYANLHPDVIVGHAVGQETHGKENVIKFFDEILQQVDVKLTSYEIVSLDVSDQLAVGQATYTIYFTEKGKPVASPETHDWHLVWKKTAKGKWKIYREDYQVQTPK